MRKELKKYFWDGLDNISQKFILKRILEYASFPDMIKLDYDILSENIGNINLDRLRTDIKRILFIKTLLPYIPESSSWEECIEKMLRNGALPNFRFKPDNQ